MPAHRLFDKGNKVWGIVTAQNRPEIHLPVKCMIMDTRWDPVNPKYMVKILRFYDNFTFIKQHFFEMNFSKQFGQRARLMGLKADDFENMEQLLAKLHGANAERYYVQMDSVMCFVNLNTLRDRFQKLQLYMISKNLKQIRQSTTRQLYKGPMRIDGNSEYKARMKRAWGDTFEDTDIDFDKYLDSLG